MSDWQMGVKGARVTSDGEMRVGATALVARELMGQTVEALLTSYDPPPGDELRAAFSMGQGPPGPGDRLESP